MIMLGSVCVWHAIITRVVASKDVDAVDDWGLLGLASFFVIAHVAIFAVIYVTVSETALHSHIDTELAVVDTLAVFLLSYALYAIGYANISNR